MHLMMWCWTAFLIYRRGCCWRHWCCAGCFASSSGSEVTSCLQQPCVSMAACWPDGGGSSGTSLSPARCLWILVSYYLGCYHRSCCASSLFIWQKVSELAGISLSPAVNLANQCWHFTDLSLLLNLCQKAAISRKENVKHALLSELSWNDRLAIKCKLCCIHVIVSLSVVLGWKCFFFLAAWSMQVTISKKWFPSVFSPSQPICVTLAHNQAGAAPVTRRDLLGSVCKYTQAGSQNWQNRVANHMLIHVLRGFIFLFGCLKDFWIDFMSTS